MRRYRFAPVAAEALYAQVDYLISKNALQAARALEQRLRAFVGNTLCRFPFSGSYIAERETSTKAGFPVRGW